MKNLIEFYYENNLKDFGVHMKGKLMKIKIIWRET